MIEDLPPHPWSSRIGGAASVVLRAGGNGHVVTGALGVGYVGSWPRSDPWIGWAGHVVGGRVVVSMNRSLDDPRDWSATLGLELEPTGAVHAAIDLVAGDWPGWRRDQPRSQSAHATTVASRLGKTLAMKKSWTSGSRSAQPSRSTVVR